MVIICSETTYPNNESDALGPYDEYFKKYVYELSIFQKHSIRGIIDGNHVLVCAPTGSGKSLPAEFAIEFFASKKEKVIYTSPIKALGNQKYNEFTTKYPHISFGLITGDIKINPDAQVLIMTAEILLNKIVGSKSTASTFVSSQSSFDIDIQTELSCVVMDEVHYINDAERGKVWEETIMLLPSKVQMVMLSATIDAPEKFAAWCEGVKPETGTCKKSVVLAHTYTRIVPLTHYSFIVTPVALYKSIKDKTKEEELKKNVFNQMICMQTASGTFSDSNFHLVNNAIKLISDKHVEVKRGHVLNELCKHLKENDMLPALCFVLSRKRLEQCAKEITYEILEDDSKVGYIVKRECEQIIRKLPNYKEYLNLPEYVQMVSLLEKGVAIHHAGVMPVLRELVEILYSRGYIKLLFATETFSVGLNMPTKTTIFTDISKFDGSGLRSLHAHEYTQMAGRAGRRGIDVVGHVVHLPNLYSSFTLTSFKMMLGNKAQRLESKFRISYNMVFNCMSTKGVCAVVDICDHVRSSMLEKEVRMEATQMVQTADDAKTEHDKCLVSCTHLKTPVDAVETYIALLEEKPKCVNKRRKEVDRAIQRLTDEHKFIEKDKQTVLKRNQTRVEWDKASDDAHNCQTYIENCIKIVLHLLTRNGYVFEVVPESLDRSCASYAFTTKGQYAHHFREINCLLFSELYDMKVFEAMDECQIACFFSCFTNVSVPDDKRAARVDPKCSIKEVVDFSSTYLEKVIKEEGENRIRTGVNCEMQIDMIDYVEEWWWAQNEIECKIVLERVKEEKQVSLGEFVKTLIKINNIKDEMAKVAEANGDITLLNKLVEIPVNTLKFVATNQSLYV